MRCDDDFDCLRGQFCATDKSLCLEEGQQKIGQEDKDSSNSTFTNGISEIKSQISTKKASRAAPTRTKRRRQKKQLRCDDEFDCLRGQYCATDKSLCFDEGHQQFGEECTRSGGNFHKILHKL